MKNIPVKKGRRRKLKRSSAKYYALAALLILAVLAVLGVMSFSGGKERKAPDLIISAGPIEPVKKEASQSAPAVKQASGSHTVKEGETLWLIAGELYGDNFMWPALYHQNEQAIKDPAMIFPGQVLMVRNPLTKDEADKARKEAWFGLLK